HIAISRATRKNVVARPAFEVILPSASDQDIFPAPSVEMIIARLPLQIICPIATEEKLLGSICLQRRLNLVVTRGIHKMNIAGRLSGIGQIDCNFLLQELGAVLHIGITEAEARIRRIEL